MGIPMSSGGDHESPARTRRSGLRYLFTAKHHGYGSSRDATWSPELSHEDEFGIFDTADWHEIVDDAGNMYGVLRDDVAGRLRRIGTRNQQLAKFPVAAVGHLWHGYPLLPVDDGERSPPPRRVPREVWARLRGDNVQHAALLTPAEARNLKKGKMA